MSADVRCTSNQATQTIPGRLSDRLFAELAEALELSADSPVDSLRDWAENADVDTLGPRLLELLLLRPPIPAGCTALVAAMEHGADTPPWITHEVPEDRVSLWTAHTILHVLMPARFSAPSARMIELTIEPAPAPSAYARPAPRLNLTAQALAASPAFATNDAENDPIWHTDATLDGARLHLSVWGPDPSSLNGVEAGTAWQIPS